jgi:hypothetical protein
MYVYIKIKIEKKSRIVYFFIRKDRILRGRKERVTIWFWLAGRSYIGKLKNGKIKKSTADYLIFLHLDKDSYSSYSGLERSNWIKISSCPYYYIFSYLD